MKKIFALILAVMMIMSLVACGGGKTTTSSTTTSKTNTSTTTTTTTTKTEEIVIGVPGVLYFINLKDGDEAPIKGLSLSGNQSFQDLNNWDYSTEEIRFIFNLSEWIEFYLEPGSKDSFEVYIVKHAENQAVYDKMSYAVLVDSAVASVTLEKPDDADDYWGSTYVFHEENEPGYYDMIFTRNSKLVARMVTKLYGELDLDKLSADQCMSLMKEEIAKFKA